MWPNDKIYKLLNAANMRSTRLPKLLPEVMQALYELKDKRGSNPQRIISLIEKKLKRPRPNIPLRNLTMQVRRALKAAIESGVVQERAGLFQLTRTRGGGGGRNKKPTSKRYVQADGRRTRRKSRSRRKRQQNGEGAAKNSTRRPRSGGNKQNRHRNDSYSISRIRSFVRKMDEGGISSAPSDAMSELSDHQDDVDQHPHQYTDRLRDYRGSSATQDHFDNEQASISDRKTYATSEPSDLSSEPSDHYNDNDQHRHHYIDHGRDYRGSSATKDKFVKKQASTDYFRDYRGLSAINDKFVKKQATTDHRRDYRGSNATKDKFINKQDSIVDRKTFAGKTVERPVTVRRTRSVNRSSDARKKVRKTSKVKKNNRRRRSTYQPRRQKTPTPRQHVLTRPEYTVDPSVLDELNPTDYSTANEPDNPRANFSGRGGEDGNNSNDPDTDTGYDDKDIDHQRCGDPYCLYRRGDDDAYSSN